MILAKDIQIIDTFFQILAITPDGEATYSFQFEKVAFFKLLKKDDAIELSFVNIGDQKNVFLFRMEKKFEEKLNDLITFNYFRLEEGEPKKQPSKLNTKISKRVQSYKK